MRDCGQSRKGQGTQAGCPQQPALWPQSMWRRLGSSVDRTSSGVPSGAALCPPVISLVCSFTTFGSRINRDKWKAQQAAVVCPACGTPPRTWPSSSPLGGTAPRTRERLRLQALSGAGCTGRLCLSPGGGSAGWAGRTPVPPARLSSGSTWRARAAGPGDETLRPQQRLSSRDPVGAWGGVIRPRGAPVVA